MNAPPTSRRGAVNSVLLTIASRTYAISLRAYPRQFRTDVGASMVDTFADRCRAASARGGAALARIWLRGVSDSLFNGVAERLRDRFPAPMNSNKPPRSPRRRFPMSLLFDDVKRAARRLRRAPTFTTSVVLTIAIGIGAFVSIYSVLDTVLWEALPYKDPDRLAYIWRNYTWADFPRGWAGGVEVLAMRDNADAIEDVAVMRSGSLNLSSRDGGDPEEVSFTLTSANFFDVLGTQPIQGRGFRAGEDVEGAPLVVVLGHSLWQQRYGADTAIIGRQIYIDDESAEVIGIMPEAFRFAVHSSLGTPSTAEAYLNLRWDLAGVEGGSLAALARVREGVTPEVVQAQLDAVAEPIDREIFDGLGLRLWPAYMHEDLVKESRPALLALIGAATFMLMILCVNLATLLLGRGTGRSREMAVSAALGAGRGALVRGGVIESSMLAMAGGALGLLIARWGTAAIAEAAVDLPRRHAIAVDGSAAIAAFCVAMTIGIFAGLAPAIQAARTDVAATLRHAGGRVTAGRAPGAMVVAQVAISLMLLVGAGVLSRSFLYLLAADPGFDAQGVLTARLPVAPERYPGESELMAFYDDVLERVAALPGVEAVGSVNALPLTAATSQNAVTFPGAPGNTGGDADSRLIDWFTATPGYFEAMGVQLFQGREFTRGDGAESPRVAIIDDTLARHFFPNDEPTGKTVTFFGEERTIVGVVDQARLYNLHADDRGQVFIPLAQRTGTATSLAIRTSVDPLSLAPALLQLVRSIDGDQPVAEIRTMAEIADASLSGERLSLGMIGGFSIGALLLATLGLYGVVSNTVTSRTREMGVRMALGADGARVRAMIVGRGMRLTLAGVVLGVAGSLLTGRFLESLLVGVRASDPLTLVVVSVGMAALTLVACYIPARRASAVDPLVALRHE